MRQIILNIKDNKYNFFMELIKSLDFVHVQNDTSDSKEAITANLKQAFTDLKNYKKGNLKTTSAKEFLNEL